MYISHDSHKSFLVCYFSPPPLCCYPSRFALSAVNMEQTDYDSRTALHIAAAEGDTSLLVHSFLNSQVSFSIKNKLNLKLGLLTFPSQVMWTRLSS